MTVVDAGPNGWWKVEHEDVPRGGGREEPVMIARVPTTLADLVDALGDVVTGRAAGATPT